MAIGFTRKQASVFLLLMIALCETGYPQNPPGAKNWAVPDDKPEVVKQKEKSNYILILEKEFNRSVLIENQPKRVWVTLQCTFASPQILSISDVVHERIIDEWFGEYRMLAREKSYAPTEIVLETLDYGKQSVQLKYMEGTNIHIQAFLSDPEPDPRSSRHECMEANCLVTSENVEIQQILFNLAQKRPAVIQGSRAKSAF
ncbi:MAG: hypothetical protein R3A11_04390 [Bdellovibrionota bacterium]